MSTLQIISSENCYSIITIKENVNLICHPWKFVVFIDFLDVSGLPTGRVLLGKWDFRCHLTCNSIDSEGLACVKTTCHHPLPEPPSQSECEVAGLQGPRGPSDMSDCCCSCQGNQGRQCDRRWHFLSSLHRTLRWKKETVKKTKVKSWMGELCKMQWSSALAGGFGRKPEPLQRLHHGPLDCSWTTSAHLCVCVCVWVRSCVVDMKKHYRFRAAAENARQNEPSESVQRVMWSSFN